MSNSEPYLRVFGSGKKAVLQITGIGNNNKDFPLTIPGCVKAGEYLFELRQSNWMCSSSIDFPQEHKKWFNGDIRQLIMEGYVNLATVEYPKEDWKYEVANDDTVLGYSEWVEHRIESDSDRR